MKKDNRKRTRPDKYQKALKIPMPFIDALKKVVPSEEKKRD